MRDFWDLDNDGKLDPGESAMKDAYYLNILDENTRDGLPLASSAIGGLFGLIGMIAIILGLLVLLSSCVA